jgi:hypothetical protein
VRRRWLGTLLLTPLLLGACAKGGSTIAIPTPSGSPWVVVANGSATRSPVPSYPAGTRTPFPSGFLPLPSSTGTATPTAGRTCPPDGKH